MQANMRKAELLPLKLSMLVFGLTLLVYLFGPIPWIQEWDTSETILVLLLVSYFVAFWAGYFYRHRSSKGLEVKTAEDGAEKSLSDQWMQILRVTIYINLALTIANALIYSGAGSVTELLEKAKEGLFSPGDAYYGKDASSRAGSVVVWISILYSPVMYITNVLSICRFKSLKFFPKLCVIATFVIEIARWLAIGTNKGLFDVVLLLVTWYVISKMWSQAAPQTTAKKTKKGNRWRLIIAVVAIFAFFAFFGMALSSRTNAEYTRAYFERFPYNFVPEGMRFTLEKMDSYLVQGYNNLNKILEQCNFKWTMGVGNSRFLMQMLDRFLGVDLTASTYPYQLSAYGVDPLASWHTAYAWLASDITFVGIIVLMFVMGYYMCGLSRDVILHNDPIAMALLYLVIMMVANASCTNYVLAYANGFVGFWGLFALRLLHKAGVRFVWKR